MNEQEEKLLEAISDEKFTEKDAYNIRKNGQIVKRKNNPYIDIVPKENNKGIK